MSRRPDNWRGVPPSGAVLVALAAVLGALFVVAPARLAGAGRFGDGVGDDHALVESSRMTFVAFWRTRT